MTEFEEGMLKLDEFFGNGKDNLIALATMDMKSSDEGRPRPVVRTIDAYYEDGSFYCVTYSTSNKIKQIENNSEVSIACSPIMFTASGTAENLGWVMEAQNAELRTKLRSAFSEWYDMANDESDKSCCILAIHLKKGILNVNHWEKLYHMDFINKGIYNGKERN